MPRDPSGDSEEALRFVSLAAAILIDEKRRDNYDASLSPGVGSGPWRIPTASARLSAVEDGNSQQPPSHSEPIVTGLSVDVPKDLMLPSVEAFSENFPGESARPLVWIVLASLLGLLVALVASLLLASQIAPGIGTTAMLLGLMLLLATTIGAITAQRAQKHEPKQSLSHLAVIKWRRDGSVFVGVPAPQQDTTWLFRLRLAELTRTNNGYLVEPAVWRRVMARATDYSLLALGLLVLLKGLGWMLPESIAAELALGLLRSPVLFPSLVVLTAIPLEAWFTAKWRHTPGKWLLGLILISGVTHAGALKTTAVRALTRARAQGVAARGQAYGFLPLTLARIRDAVERMRHDESAWDAAGDSVILARPVAWLPATTAALVCLATSVLIALVWWQDARRTMPLLNTWVEQLRPPPIPRRPAASPDASPARTEPDTKPSEAIQPVPAQPAQPSPAREDVQRLAAQAAAAQSRRARIERAEAAVAAVHRGQGSYASLQSVCQRWTEDQPGSAEAWRCLGLAQYQNGAGTAALPALRTALRLQSKDPEVEAAILSILRPQ